MHLTVQQWLNDAHDPDFVFKPFQDEGDIIIGFVKFDSEKNLFQIREGFGSLTYDMDADRILSGGGFLDFVLQIHGKEWITAQHLKDLFDCVTCWTYREYGKFPQDFFDVAGGMNRGLDAPDAI